MKAASGRQRYNVLGAFNAITHRLIRVTNDSYVTAATVCELLQKIAALGLPTPLTPVTLVLDNARYQRCHLVQEQAGTLNIELLFLPSYSPNLNLSERLWKYVKKATLYSRHHASFAEFRSRIDQCLYELPTTYKSQMATLMTLAFQTFKGCLNPGRVRYSTRLSNKSPVFFDRRKYGITTAHGRCARAADASTWPI